MLRKEESHLRMIRTHSLAFPELPEYSCEWFWLVGNHLWMSKTFGFSHKVMMAMWSDFKQSATWLGSDVQTPLATVSDDFCGLICNHIIFVNYGDHLITTKVSFNCCQGIIQCRKINKMEKSWESFDFGTCSECIRNNPCLVNGKE